MSTARRYTITGRVQGVYFRDSTRRVAERLGIVGRAVNLPNGDVEVVCHGDPALLDELEDWLREGPPLARVSGVSSEPAADEAPPDGFSIG